MPTVEIFSGFPEKTVSFLCGLAAHNDREWFAAHKKEYETEVLEPAKAFVRAMGERLRRLSPQIKAEPRTDGSLFRLYRDTRFSPDKSPYKTNLGIFFWEGGGPRMDCPGYYFHLEPPNLMLGRRSVHHPAAAARALPPRRGRRRIRARAGRHR